MPSLEDALKWDPSVLSERGAAVEKIAGDLERENRTVTDAGDALWGDGSWTGRSANAARDHCETESALVAKVAREVRELKTQLDNSANALTFAVQNLHSKVDAARATGLTVTNNGVEASANASDAVKDSVDFHAYAITSALTQLIEIDAAEAGFIRTALTELGAVTPKPAPVPPGEGAHDWEMVSDGDLSREDIGRLLANLQGVGLTPEQIRALQNGEKVEGLPDGALTYLEDLYGSAGSRGFNNLQSALAADGSPEAMAAREALSAGVLTVSNENVSDAEGAGGLQRLPLGLLPARGPETEQLWATVAATTDMPPGNILGTQLIHTASEYADAGLGGEAAQNCLDVGTRNHESALRILTGDGNGDGTPEIDPATVLNPLFTNEWADDGASVGKLVDWMSAESTEGQPTAIRERAGEAAYALSEYLSNKDVHGQLMDMSGDNSSNLGEVNPDLLASSALGLSGYVPQISGLVYAPDMPGWPEDAPEMEATRIYTLMGTDDGASGVFYGSALASADQSIGAYFDSVQSDPARPALAEAATAGRIHALIDAGAFNVSAEQASDGAGREMDAYETKKRFYASAAAAIGPFMGGPLAGSTLSSASPWLEPQFVGQPPGGLDLDSQVYASGSGEFKTQAYAELLKQAVLRDDGFDPTGGELRSFFPDGGTSFRYPSRSGEESLFIQAVENDLAAKYPDLELDSFVSSYRDGYEQVAPPLRDTGTTTNTLVK